VRQEYGQAGIVKQTGKDENTASRPDLRIWEKGSREAMYVRKLSQTRLLT
jgi:hypothetical protein